VVVALSENKGNDDKGSTSGGGATCEGKEDSCLSLSLLLTRQRSAVTRI